MSLGIAIKAPEGIVLAAESRVTLFANTGAQTLNVNFDNATKLFSFSAPNSSIGVVTYGQAVIGFRTAQGFVTEFEATLPPDRLPTEEFAKRLSAFYLEQWNEANKQPYTGAPMVFIVAGFDDGDPYGKIFEVAIPSDPEPAVRYGGEGEFGMAWGGQREIVDRLIKGYDHRLMPIAAQKLGIPPENFGEFTRELEQPLSQLELRIPFQVLPLQDCVDLAIFFLRTTIDAQKLTVGIRGCGGFIDVATITRRDGLQFVQKKSIHGELTP